MLRLHGDATMLQQTVAQDRADGPAPERTYIITGADQAGIGRPRASSRTCLPGNVVAEPCRADEEYGGVRPGWRPALIVAKADSEGTMIVMAGAITSSSRRRSSEEDRRVRRGRHRRRPVRAFAMTFGIKPTRAETGYGYIEPR